MDDGRTSPLVAALAALGVAVGQTLDATRHLADVPAQGLVTSLEALAAVRRQADAAQLALADALALRPRDELDGLGSTSVPDLLGRHAGLPPAAAKKQLSLARSVRAGRRANDGGDHVAPAMPALGAAHAAGRISTEVLDLAARTLRRLPTRVRRTMLTGLDESLAEDLPSRSWTEAVAVCNELLAALAPDGSFDPDDHEKRRFTLTVASDGWVRVSGLLDPVTGAQLVAAVEHYAKPTPAVEAPELDPDTGLPTGRTVEVKDPRTADQRHADAIGTIALQGVASSGTRGGEPPRIIVTATAAQLAGEVGAGTALCDQTGPVSATTLRLLASRAVVQTVVMSAEGASASVLALGRAARCFTPDQRRAMFARDGGCVVPGCDVPLAQLEAHHVTGWQHGGDTDTSNGTLACPRHHVQIGLGVWEVVMRDGVPWVRPPASVDPLRRWLANPRRALRDSARTVAGRPPPGSLDDLDDDRDPVAPPRSGMGEAA